MKSKLILLPLLLVFLANTTSSAQKAASTMQLNKDLQRELMEMGKEDQKYRDQMAELMKMLSGPDSQKATAEFTELVNKQNAIDQKNIKRLEEIIGQYGWPTRSLVGKEASKVASLILQHAELSYQKKYFPLLKKAAANNEATPAQVAMLEDRILMREGKKQIYGTQLKTNDVTKKLELVPIEDEENVDIRRTSVELPPMREYLKLFGLEYKPPISPGPIASAQGRAEWLRKARWGVMTHYLPDWIEPERKWTSEDWNKLVEGFDVEGLAKQLESVGAGYYLISIGQNSGFYLAPNQNYDRLVGTQPSKCSRRDLVADLYEALHKRRIKLMVYLPSGAPNKDQVAVKALDWKNGPYPNREFLARWEQVVRDWSLRWGTKVSGWWFDGCYWPNTMYRSPEPPNFQSLTAAARAGNPNSIVALNPGVIYRTISISQYEDYIAGEIDHPDRLVIRRVVDGNVDGAQLHMLSYLGQTWGRGTPRFSSDQIITWTRQVINQGGAVTWDVPVQRNGLISQQFFEQLSALNRALSPTATSQK